MGHMHCEKSSCTEERRIFLSLQTLNTGVYGGTDCNSTPSVPLRVQCAGCKRGQYSSFGLQIGANSEEASTCGTGGHHGLCCEACESDLHCWLLQSYPVEFMSFQQCEILYLVSVSQNPTEIVQELLHAGV